MISDDQNRMAHRHQSFLLAAASGKAVVLRAEILILGVRGAVCGFDQTVAQPRTAFARAAGATLTCRLVVSRTHAGPRRQMPVARKAVHVPAGFRPQHFCRAPVHSGNRVEPPDLLLKRAQSLLDLAAEPLTCTVQAPHTAMPQPYFVPRRLRTSRITHKSGMSAGTFTVLDCPFTISLKVMALPLERDFLGRTPRFSHECKLTSSALLTGAIFCNELRLVMN